MFRAIASDNFPPFGEFQMTFPSIENKPEELAEVHLLTGINGTGKTRLLSVLAAMLGGPKPLLKRLKGSDVVFRIFGNEILSTSNPERWGNKYHAGLDEYGWNESEELGDWASAVPAFAYSGSAYLTDVQTGGMANVPKPNRENCLSFVRPEAHSQELLQAITNLKLQTAMDAMNEPAEVAGASRSTKLIKALETTLSTITGRSFSFRVASYPTLNLAVNWGGTTLAFDALPDGLRSIIGWLAHAVVMLDAWLDGEGDPMQSEAVFLLDEIENQLHPAWQRRVLPAFQKLFPKAQIFIATHSPFLIASLNHGWIHPLKMNAGGSVDVEAPVEASEGDSYVSVVEDIMGLHEWYDPETEALLSQFRASRDAAYRGDSAAASIARELAGRIGHRSMELDYMMGRELSQMDRQLARSAAAQ